MDHRIELSRVAVLLAAYRTEHLRIRRLIRTLPENEARNLVDEYLDVSSSIAKLERYRDKLMQD